MAIRIDGKDSGTAKIGRTVGQGRSISARKFNADALECQGDGVKVSLGLEKNVLVPELY